MENCKTLENQWKSQFSFLFKGKSSNYMRLCDCPVLFSLCLIVQRVTTTLVQSFIAPLRLGHVIEALADRRASLVLKVGGEWCWSFFCMSFWWCSMMRYCSILIYVFICLSICLSYKFQDGFLLAILRSWCLIKTILCCVILFFDHTTIKHIKKKKLTIVKHVFDCFDHIYNNNTSLLIVLIFQRQGMCPFAIHAWLACWRSP